MSITSTKIGLTLLTLAGLACTNATAKTTDARKEVAKVLNGHIAQAWKNTINGRTYYAVVRTISPEMPLKLDLLRQNPGDPQFYPVEQFDVEGPGQPLSMVEITDLNKDGSPELFFKSNTCGMICLPILNLYDTRTRKYVIAEKVGGAEVTSNGLEKVFTDFVRSKIGAPDFMTDIEVANHNIRAGFDWYTFTQTVDWSGKKKIPQLYVALPKCQLDPAQVSYTAMVGKQKFISTYSGSVFAVDSAKCRLQLIYHTESSSEWVGGLSVSGPKLAIINPFTKKPSATYNASTSTIIK